MKKIFLLLLVGLCAAGNCLADCPGLGSKTGYEFFGRCATSGKGYELYFTIDATATLAFWHNQDCTEDDPQGDYSSEVYMMPDFANPDTYATLNEGCLAPWDDNRVKSELPIQALDLSHSANIGKYAFCGLVNIGQVSVPYTVTEIGEFAFWGCTNLTSLDMITTDPPTIYQNSLQLDADNNQIKTILVPNEEVRTKFMNDPIWNSNGREFIVTQPQPDVVQATGAAFTDCNTQVTTDCEIDMLVGEHKKLNYTLIPADADPNSVEIVTELIHGKEIFIDADGYINAYGFGENYVYIIPKGGNKDNYLEKARVFAAYVDNGPLYDDPEMTSGQVYYSVDGNYKLQFWAETLNGDKPATSTVKYNIPNYSVDVPAPWRNNWYSNYITEVDLNNIDNVGNNAFGDILNISYQLIPENVKSLGNYVFLGCTNIKTIEVGRYDPTAESPITTTTGVSLIIDNSNPDRPIRPSVLVVSNQDKGATAAYEADGEWSMCRVVPVQGDLGDEVSSAHYQLSKSDSIGALKLTVQDNPAYPDEVAVIPDREAGESSPLDIMGDVVEDLEITGKVSYIGKNAFMNYNNIKTIQFNQADHPLDSIHAEAFPQELKDGVHPRKFSFGDPQDGPIVPPTLITGEMSEVDATLRWRRIFNDSTVLFVPDSMFEHLGQMVRAIDLYKEDNFWGNVFFRINDRTVDTTAADTSVVLTWIPLEEAQGYRLTIQEVGCADCDTTIFIPAHGLLGLIDWDRIWREGQIPQYLAAPKRRAPQEEGDGGGLVLTISIKSGSGSDHASDVAVNVAGKKGKEYTFTREVIKEGKVSEAYTKAGSFKVADKSTAIEEIQLNGEADTQRSEPMIYDLLGRRVGTSIDKLPNGIYIMDNGTERTKIMLRR